MKKYLLFPLLALLSASILVNAQTADLLLDFAYVLNTEGTGVVIREYKEKAKKVIVPAIIGDFPVVCCKLRHKWETVSVVLPDSCTEFYFEGCNSLEKVILPKELKTIRQ